MATFTTEELNVIMARGFKGVNFPLTPVYAFRKTSPSVYYEWTDQPQHLYEIGDRLDVDGGNLTDQRIIWESDTAVTATGIYAGAKKLRVTVSPATGTPQGTNVWLHWLDENDNVLSDTSQWLPLNSGFMTGVQRRGQFYITCVYNTYRDELEFAIGYTDLYDINGQDVISVIPIEIMGRSGNFDNNQPFKYFMEDGDPTWYDIESQSPEMETGGGGGGFYRPSDTNWFSGLPTLDILTFDMIAQYSVDTSDMSALASFLWSDSFINSIKKAWQSPFENIINLSFIPLGTELSTVSAEIKIGNVPTGVTSAKLTKSLYAKDFGSISMKELYKNFADYSPFTHISLYAPGCGIKNLNPDDFIDGSIHLMAYIDTFSGTVVYQVGSIRHGRKHIVDHYTGNIQTSIPITGANYASAYSSLINGLAGIGSGGMIGGAMSALTPLSGIKPEYGKSSGTSGSAMRLSVQRPYIFFDTPQLREPKNFRYLHGYVSNTYQRLGDCRGFTTVKYMDMKNINLTDTEKEELKNILETGVYINDPPTP